VDSQIRKSGYNDLRRRYRDGLNERGLGAHMLFLNAADFGPRDPGKPGIHGGLWAQYLLDNAATVTEALALLEKVQIVMTEARGPKRRCILPSRMRAAIPPSLSTSAASVSFTTAVSSS